MFSNLNPYMALTLTKVCLLPRDTLDKYTFEFFRLLSLLLLSILMLSLLQAKHDNHIFLIAHDIVLDSIHLFYKIFVFVWFYLLPIPPLGLLHLHLHTHKRL